MRLLKLHVVQFGTLKQFELTPSGGLNVLCRQNGWGKSTLAVFIKAMLYGLPATSKRSLDENERKKYAPWGGGDFGGSLEIATQKGRFRIERFFGAKEADDSFALFDLATNKPSDAYSARIGEELFGIDADGFERTTYLSQRALAGGKDSGSVTARLSSLLDDVDDIGSFEGAMAALDKRRSHYIKTGERGAIAEMERALADTERERESAARVETVRLSRERELEACRVQARELTGELETVRADMKKAGLGRERAAHAEQRARMQDELRKMTAARESINDFFRGAPPSASELDEGRRLYEEICAAKAARDAMPNAIPEENELNALRRRFPGGVPDAKTVERIESDNNELIHLHARRRVLTENITEDPILRRFSNGAPDQAELDEARESLRTAAGIQAAAQKERAALAGQKTSNAPAVLGGVLLLAGAVCTVLSLLPALLSALLPLLLAGGALLAGGVISFAMLASRKKSLRREQERAARAALAKEQKAERLAAGVVEFLTAYGMAPANVGEAAACLSELCAQSERYWNAERQRRHNRESLAHVEASIAELTKRLHGCFSAFYEGLARKTDYRAELDVLKSEIQKLIYLENADRVRRSDITYAERNIKKLQNELLPFLRRFDPAGKMLAGECLTYVSKRSDEYARLGREIAEKKSALSSFVTEKRLDSGEAVPVGGEYERLGEKEAALQAELGALTDKQARLRSEIDRLEVETERLPELADAIARQKQALDEAKANAVTIAHTAKLLTEAKTALSTRYLGGMQQSFDKNLAALIPQNTPEAVMDTSFEVRLREGGQSRTMESYSRGWRDTVEFCTRLSLTDALYTEGERPFLLLDDPFVNLDDKRLAAARRLLDALAETYQILYFICREERD